MSNMIKLDSRMSGIASFVRRTPLIADIGTDHAYIPVYLVQNGIADRALACDISEGPCAKARATVALYGLNEKIQVIRTDGLDGLEKQAPKDIVIAGMGGDLIGEILSRAAFIRDGEVRLILQPMTKAANLRFWLLENGFDITAEKLAESDQKIYQIMCASFDGKRRELPEHLLYAGQGYESEQKGLVDRHIMKELTLLRERIAGLESSASPDKAEIERLRKTASRLETLIGKS